MFSSLGEYSQLIGGYLIGLLTWFAKEMYGWFRTGQLPNKHDKMVFLKYREVFHDEFVYFLRRHDLGSSFDAEVIKGLHRFVHQALGELPNYKFHDRKLERMRLRLWKLSNEFSNECMMGLHDEFGKGTLRVPPPREWSQEKDDRRRDTIKKLNDRADELVDAFLKLNDAYNRKFDEKIVPTSEDA